MSPFIFVFLFINLLLFLSYILFRKKIFVLVLKVFSISVYLISFIFTSYVLYDFLGKAEAYGVYGMYTFVWFLINAIGCLIVILLKNIGNGVKTYN